VARGTGAGGSRSTREHSDRVYGHFFGLRELPFSLSPDPRFLWPSETHQEGLSAIVYGISYRKGFVLLTGEVGTGKTTLLRAALDRANEDLVEAPEVAMILDTADLTALDLLKLIAAEFRLAGRLYQPVSPVTTADYIIEINSFLMDRLRNGLNTVLVIDEAQNLDAAALEQVRLLSNLESDTAKPLQIVLIGQPELRRKLSDSRLRQLRQRIAIDHHVEPLAPREVGSYLRHRIEVAGGHFDQLFAQGAEGLFSDFSGGCPRLINLLADRAMLSAFAKGLRQVPIALIEFKAKELGDLKPDAPESRLPGAT
jgi:general secretion pathway protein A